MTTQLHKDDFSYVDEYFRSLLGTERQQQYAISILQEYRSTIAYMLRDGIMLPTVSSNIIDHRSDIYSYLLSMSIKQDRRIKLKST
jgi:hypothetical protein